jgi:hypothetical protein
MGNCIIVFRFGKNRGTSKSETRLTYPRREDERISIKDGDWNADDYCDSGFNNSRINP